MASTPATQLQQLAATLDTLTGGLPRITDEAKAAVGDWATALKGNKALAPVADELRKLDQAIADNHGGTVADSLSTLSELTKHAAATGTPDAQSMLYQLSDLLKKAAGQVGQ